MNSHVGGQMIFVLGAKRAMWTFQAFHVRMGQFMSGKTTFVRKFLATNITIESGFRMSNLVEFQPMYGRR